MAPRGSFTERREKSVNTVTGAGKLGRIVEGKLEISGNIGAATISSSISFQ
jgi:hypothetical protein